MTKNGHAQFQIYVQFFVLQFELDSEAATWAKHKQLTAGKNQKMGQLKTEICSYCTMTVEFHRQKSVVIYYIQQNTSPQASCMPMFFSFYMRKQLLL